MKWALSNILIEGTNVSTALRADDLSSKLPLRKLRVIPARGEDTSRIPEGLQSAERRRRARVAINSDGWPGSSAPFPLLSTSLGNWTSGQSCGFTSNPFIQM